jgi:hypothetical protein
MSSTQVLSDFANAQWIQGPNQIATVKINSSLTYVETDFLRLFTDDVASDYCYYNANIFERGICFQTMKDYIRSIKLATFYKMVILTKCL